MITGAILEKGEVSFTYLKKIFLNMDNFQKQYNWLITDCEAVPFKYGHSLRIHQSKDGRYAWISGEELTNMIKKDDFQWVWGVLSGFKKEYTEKEILKYSLPYADCYDGFWKENISMQHPLADIELVAWDSTLTLFISKYEPLVEKFKKSFPLSQDLKEYNMGILKDQTNELENWLKKSILL